MKKIINQFYIGDELIATIEGEYLNYGEYWLLDTIEKENEIIKMWAY